MGTRIAATPVLISRGGTVSNAATLESHQVDPSATINVQLNTPLTVPPCDISPAGYSIGAHNPPDDLPSPISLDLSGWGL